MPFVESDLSMRMWRAYKQAGKPFPKLDSDDVVDYLIMEALATKSAKEDTEARRQAEIETWRKDHTALENIT